MFTSCFSYQFIIQSIKYFPKIKFPQKLTFLLISSHEQLKSDYYLFISFEIFWKLFFSKFMKRHHYKIELVFSSWKFIQLFFSFEKDTVDFENECGYSIYFSRSQDIRLIIEYSSSKWRKNRSFRWILYVLQMVLLNTVKESIIFRKWYRKLHLFFCIRKINFHFE